MPTTNLTSLRVATILAFFLGLLPAGAARAQLAVEDISIVAGVQDSQWAFLVEVFGSGITSATITPPGEAPIPLTDGSGTGKQFEFEAGSFASFAALKAARPSGNYVVTVNGDHVVTLAWDPTEITAAGPGQPTLVIDTPADGAVGVSTMPDVAFSFDCTNCDDLRLEIFDLATGGMAAGLNFGELDVMPAGNFTNPILFGDMMTGESPPNPLANGLTEVDLLIGSADFSDLSFDVNPSAHPMFQYIQASVVLAESTVTVPEASSAAAAMAVFGAVLYVTRRREA